jgi:integrase
MSSKLTKTFVESVPYALGKQVFYRDSQLKGFGLRVGATTKTYIAEAKVNGKVVRVSIGKHGVFTAEQARERARQLLALMSSGTNPNDIKAEKKAKGIILHQAFEDFQNTRKGLKPRTLKDYTRIMNTDLSDWKHKPLLEITKDMVSLRHTEIGRKSPAQANLTMRFLRSLFNFAAGRYEDRKGNTFLHENPVRRLSQTRAWFRIKQRQTVIERHNLGSWLKAVVGLKNDHTGPKREIVRDYLLVLLFTGLRRQEAAKLLWKDVDLKNKTLTVRDTKNHQDHVLPLSTFLWSIFERLKKLDLSSPYVFPGEGKEGHIVEPKKQVVRVIRESRVSFTLHDLRRTFITIAESLDIPHYAVKRLANHKMGNDVTAGYIIPNVDRLREPMQKITNHILKMSEETCA